MSTISTVKKRINWVDTAKGIGIFLVVFAHVNSSISDQIYLFHMPLFFFLSGMFFKNDQNFRHFILNKIQYLIIPFIIFLTISIPVRILYFSIINDDYSLVQLIRPSTSNVPLWFLPALFIVNLIFYFKKYKFLNYIILLINIFGVLTFGSTNFHFQTFSKIIYCLAFFILGNFFFENIIIFLRNMNLIFIISIILFTYGIHLTLYGNFRLDLAINKAEGGGLLHLLIGLSGVISIICICIYINKFSSYISSKIITFINYLGKSSMSILDYTGFLFSQFYYGILRIKYMIMGYYLQYFYWEYQ